MPILLLSRPTPLTPAEVKALPRGCTPCALPDGGIARADVDLPLPELLAFAVAMGRAAPDAAFSVQERAISLAKPEPEPEVITEHDPWKLVEAGQAAQAERVFAAGNGLDGAGRERCRVMLLANDPETVALACRIARITDWKSAATGMRRLLSHAHPSVRRDAAQAIGALAGPSLAIALRPLLTDPDAEVREVTKKALERLGG